MGNRQKYCMYRGKVDTLAGFNGKFTSVTRSWRQENMSNDNDCLCR